MFWQVNLNRQVSNLRSCRCSSEIVTGFAVVGTPSEGVKSPKRYTRPDTSRCCGNVIESSFSPSRQSLKRKSPPAETELRIKIAASNSNLRGPGRSIRRRRNRRGEGGSAAWQFSWKLLRLWVAAAAVMPFDQALGSCG
jgi:hypothetical protein